MRTLTALFVLAITAAAVLAQPSRPQHPLLPYPYESIELEIPVTPDGADEPTHTLAATLTIPDPQTHGPGPHPAVVLMSGSGGQDRDSTLMGHKPFLVLADRLTRAGVAVLRYDDRGVGRSTGNLAESTSQDLARDGQACAHFLMDRDDIDANRVGLLGHSEGGGHVPLIAAEDDSIAFIISLAGMGVSGAEVLIDQTALMYRRGGNDEAFIDGAMQRRRAVFNAITNDAPEDELVELIAELNRFEYRAPQLTDAHRAAARQMLGAFTGVWMRSFIAYDPGEYWAKVTVPVLAINGGRDTQVTPQLNLTAIRDALTQAGNTRATVIELTGLNHLLQPAQSGLVGEYGAIETTIDPTALALIEAWLRSEVESTDKKEDPAAAGD